MMKEPVGALLVVDDDATLRRALTTTLQAVGFHVQESNNGEEALTSTRIMQFDAVLLDINMPGMGGMETCRQLREMFPLLPILMLSVRGSQDDIVSALDAGADDYIAKPFHFGELTARLPAVLRRKGLTNPPPKEFTIGALRLDPVRRKVWKNERKIHLTPKEFDLLHFLMKHAGLPVNHSKLLRAVWGAEYGSELEYLRTFVRQVRLKIEDDPSRPAYLFTDAHVGYRFC